MATFKELNLTKQLLNSLMDMGFEAPTPIQAKAFPVVMSGRDAVGIAQTGTGKTIAYLLPILRQLNYSEQRQPRVLILVPTRELVVQVESEVNKLAKYMRVRCVGIYGGANINTQKQQVYDGVDVLVATPGRLADLSLNRTVQFHSVQKLVIDEVDEMLNLGFRPQLLRILELLPLKRQNLLFSATLTEEVEKMIEDYFHKPEYIELISRGTPLAKIIQMAYYVPNFYTKINLLKHLLRNEPDFTKVLVFVKNKKIADDVYKELNDEFADAVGVIHSNKSQSQRFNAVKKFDEGTYQLLMATDVIARGLDLKDVTHVVNFDMPSKEPETYIHRIGRTGRADKAGTAVSFMTKAEQTMQKAVEALMKKKIELLILPKEVEISTQLTKDEKPVTRDKSLKKTPKQITPTGAFHEKKEKNKKVNLGGKRRQENRRRIQERKSRKKY